MNETTIAILIIVAIVFFIIYGIPIILMNKAHKGKTHQHKVTYCILKSCPYLREYGITQYCELKKCIYDKDNKDKEQ